MYFLFIIFFTPVVVGIGGLIYSFVTDYRNKKFLDSTQHELLEEGLELLAERRKYFENPDF